MYTYTTRYPAGKEWKVLRLELFLRKLLRDTYMLASLLGLNDRERLGNLAAS